MILKILKSKKILVCGLILLPVTLVLFYLALDNPIGLIFNLTLFLAAITITMVFLLLSAKCFSSKKVLIKSLGILPALLFIIFLVVYLAIIVDHRILYYQGIPPNPTKAEWVEDVNYLADKMREIHPSLYTLVSENKFTNTIKEIESKISDLSESQTIMELFRLIAVPNDAHCFPFIFFPCFDLHGYPLQIYGFEDGWFVVDAANRYEHLIGTEIIKIDTTSMNEIFQLFQPYIATENNTGKLERFTYLVLMPEWLESQDIIEEMDEAPLTFEKSDGELITQMISSTPFLNSFYWSSIRKIENESPAYLSNPRDLKYWFKIIEPGNTLYIQFNQVENQSGHETISQFADRITQFIKMNKIDKTVIDIRNNDGGNDLLLEDLTAAIRDSEQINQQGKLFVLIGRRTFSSAVIFANQLQLQTKAIFMGEPTGQGPIFFGNPNLVRLPNSGLVFSVSTTSTERTQATWPFIVKNEISPDISVLFSSKDFVNGTDPVLAAALNYKLETLSYSEIPDSVLDYYSGRYIISDVQVMDIGNNGNSLSFRITDFIPQNRFEIRSGLYAVNERMFNTDISNVKFLFPPHNNQKVQSVTINWSGKEYSYKRAPEDYKLALELFEEDRFSDAIQIILDNKTEYQNQFSSLENILNGIGYNYLREKKILSAIEIFRLNVTLYPESFNVYDSYGEALMVNGDMDAAINNYRKSIEINPANDNAIKVLKKLGAKI